MFEKLTLLFVATFHPVVFHLCVKHLFFGGRVFWHWFITTVAFEAFATLSTEFWLAAIFPALHRSSTTLVAS